MTSNPWYDIAAPAAPLTQGDLLFDCPLVCWRDDAPDYAAAHGAEPPTAPFVAWRRLDVIVLTQACDLEHGKVRHVVLAPHAALVDSRKAWEGWMRGQGQNPSEKSWRRACEDIAAGYVWNLTFLDQFHHPELGTGVRVVDFHQVFTAPRTLLEAQLRYAGRPRLRLRAPYVEYLSQAFARYFMRVGLPQPVTPEWEAKGP
jgi:hypothetical protein